MELPVLKIVAFTSWPLHLCLSSLTVWGLRGVIISYFTLAQTHAHLYTRTHLHAHTHVHMHAHTFT